MAAPKTDAAQAKTAKTYTVPKALRLVQPWSFTTRAAENDGISVNETTTYELSPIGDPKEGKIQIHVKGTGGTLSTKTARSRTSRSPKPLSSEPN